MDLMDLMDLMTADVHNPSWMRFSNRSCYPERGSHCSSANYSSPDRFITVGAVALPFSRLRAYCNCLSFSGSFGTYD